MTTVAPGVRVLTPDDVDAVVDLATVCEIAENGEPDPELVDWIRGSEPEHFRLWGVDDEHGLAAFAMLHCDGGHTGLEAEIRVRPGVDHDRADTLLACVRTAAAEFDPTKPLHVLTNSTATTLHRWLARHGGREVRHFWRMAIDLDDAEPSVPPAPERVVVRRAHADDADLNRIFDVVDAAFVGHFGHSDERDFDRWMEIWRAREGFDLALWWVAEIDDAPVAALLATTFPGTGHVGTLGTLPPARGRGIGSYLLRLSFAEFHRRGLRRVTLGVDSENGTGAVRLYESVGMSAVNDWPLYELPALPIACTEP